VACRELTALLGQLQGQALVLVQPPGVGPVHAGSGDELRRRAGLDWLRLHDLRHGCATLLLARGVSDRVIMEVLGHAEIGVTMNTYAHVLPVLRHEAADTMDELFGA
jgi:integrase